MTLHDLIEKARASAQKLQPSEGAVLFAAAVRLAATRGATLRPRLIEIDEAGALHLLPFDENAPEPASSYLAPEARTPGGPRKTEPRVQVYAAGALGYELLTGRPAPSGAPGNELSGALGDIVRIALAADRRERFGDLNQLQDALAGVQPRPPAEGERNILLALRTRFARPPPEKEAVARLIEKVAALEQQIAKVQARTESLREGFERFEEGERRRAERKPSSSAVPGFIAGVLGAALVLGVAWVTGFAGRGGTVVGDTAMGADAGTRTASVPPPEQTAPTDDGNGRDAAASRTGNSRAAGPGRPGVAGVAGAGAAAAAASGARAAEARQRSQRGADAGSEVAAAPQVSGADASAEDRSDDNAAEASDDAADASQTAGASQPHADTSSESIADASTAGAAVAAPGGGAVAAPTASDSAANASPADGGVASASGTAASPQPSSAPQPATPRPQRVSSARGAKQKGVSPSAINHAFALSQVRRGESALEHGHADDAVSSFRSALDNEPGIAVAYRGLGMAYAVQGNDAEALRAYEKYLQLVPGAKDAKDIRRSMAEIKDRAKLGEEK